MRFRRHKRADELTLRDNVDGRIIHRLYRLDLTGGEQKIAVQTRAGDAFGVASNLHYFKPAEKVRVR
jgi:hypothetical protein